MKLLEAIPDLAIPEKSLDVGLRLKEIHLPAGLVPGFDVEWLSGGTGHTSQYRLDGYDGFKFIGEGRDSTHIIPTPSSQFATVVIGPGAKRVEFHGVTIHGAWGQGKGRAVHYGTENLPLLGIPQEHLSIVFVDYEIVADEPDAGPWVKVSSSGNTSVWGVFGYGAELISFRGKIRWKRGAEHGYYPHGTAGHGIIYDTVDWEGNGAECAKFACRPGESYPTPGAYLLVQNCTFQDWYQPWTWRGGGGVVVQGGGINVIVQDNQFYGGPGNQKSRCVMIDDGGKDRFYNAITGEPGTGPANGHIGILRNLIVGDGTENWGTLARVGTLSPGAGIEVARSYAMGENGVYTRLGALQTKVEISGVSNVLLQDNNTEAIRSAADALVPIGTEAMVSGLPAGTFALSKGYRSGIFQQADPVPA